MSNFNDLTIPQGWECPKCKRVYSPTTIMCIACPQYTKSTTTSDTPIGVGGYGTTTNSTSFLHRFESDEKLTSQTKCKICGVERWQHPSISFT